MEPPMVGRSGADSEAPGEAPGEGRHCRSMSLEDVLSLDQHVATCPGPMHQRIDGQDMLKPLSQKT